MSETTNSLELIGIRKPDYLVRKLHNYGKEIFVCIVVSLLDYFRESHNALEVQELCRVWLDDVDRSYIQSRANELAKTLEQHYQKLKQSDLGPTDHTKDSEQIEFKLKLTTHFWSISAALHGSRVLAGQVKGTGVLAEKETVFSATHNTNKLLQTTRDYLRSSNHDIYLYKRNTHSRFRVQTDSNDETWRADGLKAWEQILEKLQSDLT